MFSKGSLDEIELWRRQAISPEQQLDRRWLARYRDLASYDGHWWLAHAGPFTEEEQRQWDQLYASALADSTKDQLSQLLVESRKRELAAALAEQREPHLCYPAIDIADMRRRIAEFLQLDREIDQNESNSLVRRLYHGAIEEELDFLHLIEATYEGDTEKFWLYNCRLDPMLTLQEMEYALAYLKRTLSRGLRYKETREESQHVHQLLRTQFALSLDLFDGSTSGFESLQQHAAPTCSSERTVTAQTAKRFFEAVLHESRYHDWRVVIDSHAINARIEQGMRYMFLPDEKISIGRMRHLIAHELAGHVTRCVAGSHSPIGLLGINTQHALSIEEGLALYHERQATALYGDPFDDWGTWIGAFVVGLVCGVMTPPQTFLSLMPLLESLHLIRRQMEHWDDTMQQARKRAQNNALARCLRTFRGVPNLENAGICYSKDIVYLRGLSLVEQAVIKDETVLDRLAIGVVSLDLLPDLQELKLTSPPQLLRDLAYDPDLESHILSFEIPEEDEYLPHATV